MRKKSACRLILKKMENVAVIEDQTQKVLKTKPKKLFPVLNKWHRRLGLLAVIPVIFWCSSGLMHPFMAHWFKPKIASEFIFPKPVNSSQIIVPIQETLEKNGLNEIKNFRYVSFQSKTFYQVKAVDDMVRYFDAETGQEFANGEKLYAEHLARYFLGDSTSVVKNIVLQTSFDKQYKFINRLLPVWRLDFDRKDNMTIYVDTWSDRLGTFNPTSRKIFLWIFDTFHNWSFLDYIVNNTLRIIVMISFLTVIAFSALSGIFIYGFLWNKIKPQKGYHQKGGLRKYHRQIGLAVAVVTLSFAFSGGYHATKKLAPSYLPAMVYEPEIESGKIGFSNLDLLQEKTINIGLAQINGDVYFQVVRLDENKQKEFHYFNASNGEVLEDGNEYYVKFLASHFTQKLNNEFQIKTVSHTDKLLTIDHVNRFETGEYGFIFKRLPVVRLGYDTSDKTAIFIEPSTGRMAAKIDDSDRREGLSFAIFHKYLLMDWAGKNIRDFTMMISAFGVLSVSLLGLALYLKK